MTVLLLHGDIPIYIETLNTVYEYYDSVQHHKLYITENHKTYDKLLLIASSGSVNQINEIITSGGVLTQQRVSSAGFAYWDNGTLRQGTTFTYFIILSNLSDMEYIDFLYSGTGPYVVDIYGIN